MNGDYCSQCGWAGRAARAAETLVYVDLLGKDATIAGARYCRCCRWSREASRPDGLPKRRGCQ